ncbi:MAG: endonuclease III [Betaproteobacteria bacterium]|nr:endonuclease III [Betaproteobacteria bacterium]
MKLETVSEFFRRLAERTPEPRTELEFGNPYQLLVAVVLSAQTTDKGVNLATRRLFPLTPTPQAMIALGERQLAERIKTIGFFRAKAKNVIKLSHLLVERYAGEVPPDRTALESLPGVGRKTANVVLNTIFRQPIIAVDRHVFRVANRTGLAPGKDVDEVETSLMKTVPADYLLDAHHWLILHGRYVCTAKKPLCSACCVYDLCNWSDRAT